MGTYLELELKDRSEENINTVNKAWNDENPGYENTLHFTSREDIEKDIEYIKTDPKQAHLRYIETVAQWDEHFTIWSYGQFQVKITLGDYLCSEMARRYIAFVDKYHNLFVEEPSNYVISILAETARENRTAESCLVNCQTCKPQEATP